MRLLASTVFISIVVAIGAAPAIIWRGTQDSSSQVKQITEAVHVSSVIASTFSKDESSLDVFFLMGRNSDGSEALSALASSGALPNIASKYENAESIKHHVDGIESSHFLVSVAKEHFEEPKSTGKVLEITLSELNRKLTGVKIPTLTSESTSGGKKKHRRALALEKASIVIVKTVFSESPTLDSAVLRAIESENVANVILAGQRSNMEVKEERNIAAKRRMAQRSGKSRFVNTGRRRLEDADGDDNNNNDEDLSGVYYVNMTPNIFAGILFSFLFIFVIQIGIGCLGGIQGPPDLYVKKYPVIGREA